MRREKAPQFAQLVCWEAGCRAGPQHCQTSPTRIRIIWKGREIPFLPNPVGDFSAFQRAVFHHKEVAMTLSFPIQLQHLASGKGEETHEEWMGRHQGQQRTCQAPRMLQGPSSNLQALGRKEEKQEPKLQMLLWYGTRRTRCSWLGMGLSGWPWGPNKILNLVQTHHDYGRDRTSLNSPQARQAVSLSPTRELLPWDRVSHSKPPG